MFGPLAFENRRNSEAEEYETQCLLCCDKFNLKLGLHIFLSHLFEVHSIVIDDVQNINYLPRYVNQQLHQTIRFIWLFCCLVTYHTGGSGFQKLPLKL